MIYDQLMVDIETLGTGPNAAILSIGAVRFSLPDPQGLPVALSRIHDPMFEVIVKPDDVQGTIDASTVFWWMKQSDEAREALICQGTKISHLDALKQFKEFAESVPCDSPTIWSNGPTFDETILRNAFARAGLQWPFKFYASRDVRTIRQMRDFIGLPSEPNARTAHKALDDAIFQAIDVIKVYDHIAYDHIALLQRGVLSTTDADKAFIAKKSPL